MLAADAALLLAVAAAAAAAAAAEGSSEVDPEVTGAGTPALDACDASGLDDSGGEPAVVTEITGVFMGTEEVRCHTAGSETAVLETAEALRFGEELAGVTKAAVADRGGADGDLPWAGALRTAIPFGLGAEGSSEEAAAGLPKPKVPPSSFVLNRDKYVTMLFLS